MTPLAATDCRGQNDGMSDKFCADLLFRSEDQAARFGTCLAPFLSAGDTILLEGPIGAGKTHLARAIIRKRLEDSGLGEDIPSPTFTLVQTYSDGKTEIWHADLYRLTDPQEVLELGLDEAFETAIVLVEWPDRLGDTAPPDALVVRLSHEGDARHARLSSSSARWGSIVPTLEEEA